MNEKLMINANLLRKESEFRTQKCIVEKAAAVSHAEFLNLKQNPLRDNEMIAENVDLMYCDKDDNYHCLLVYDDQGGDGLLIESEGASSVYFRSKRTCRRASEFRNIADKR